MEDLESKTIEINIGPQHPATHGVLRLKTLLDGENIVEMEPVIGYLHRGIEKWHESRTYVQGVPMTDRLDYVSAPVNNLGYVQTVEKLLGLTVPPRAETIRIILAELTRIASHLLWLGTHALDIGAMTMLFYPIRERETILDLFESYCGARLTTNAFIIGGLRHDLPKGWVEKTRSFLDDFPARMKEYEILLSTNRMWLDRTKGVGVISAEDAVAYGLSGPPLRGSGVEWDVRKNIPYGTYPDYDFEIPVGEAGDTYDRYLVRLEEMRQSRRIIFQALEKLEEGEIKAKAPRVVKPPKGEVYHFVEAPKGMLGYYMVSDGTPNPFRMRIRVPSFYNLQAIPVMAKGHLIADVVAIIGTLDIVLGEIDR